MCPLTWVCSPLHGVLEGGPQQSRSRHDTRGEKQGQKTGFRSVRKTSQAEHRQSLHGFQPPPGTQMWTGPRASCKRFGDTQVPSVRGPLLSQVTEMKGQLTPDFPSAKVCWPGFGLLSGGVWEGGGQGCLWPCSDYNQQEVTGWERWSK